MCVLTIIRFFNKHKLIQPENDTEHLLLSKTENCEMLIKQTHRKPQEILDFKLTRT